MIGSTTTVHHRVSKPAVYQPVLGMVRALPWCCAMEALLLHAEGREDVWVVPGLPWLLGIFVARFLWGGLRQWRMRTWREVSDPWRSTTEKVAEGCLGPSVNASERRWSMVQGLAKHRNYEGQRNASTELSALLGTSAADAVAGVRVAARWPSISTTVA